MRISRFIGAALIVATAFPAAAQTAARKAVRGTVESIDANVLAVKAKDGQLVPITLAPDWNVRVLIPTTVDAIRPGSFIGTAQMPQADGSGRSIEVHVFPPGVKSGEGERDWDSKPGARMTNGTVEGQIISTANGRELTVVFPNGSRKITIPPDAPIVQFGVGQRAQVKPGTPVFVIAMPDGAGWKTSGVAVGQNGATPPM